MQQKKVRELLSALVNLISIAEIVTVLPESNAPHVAFKTKSNTWVLFCGQDKINQFEDTVERFWKAKDEIYTTISKKLFQEKITDFMSDYLQGDKVPNETDIKHFFRETSEISTEEWEVFRPLYGAELETSDKLELGSFTVWNFVSHQSLLIAKYPQLHEDWKIMREALESQSSGNLVVSVRVTALDGERAEELADERFRQFEHVMRYMIGDTTGEFDIWIFDYRNPTLFRCMVLSPTRALQGNRIKDRHTPIKIDDPFFGESRADHTWIWNALTQPNPNELQTRILAAVEWIGKGMRDPDTAKAFVQFIIAFEALLTFREQGTIVSPSIASQLAEFSAYIVGDGFDSRLEVEKSVKKLYDRRSAVAHGGSKSVLKSEVIEALKIVRNLIKQITTNPELSAMTSMPQLRDWVLRKKYT
jgi:hypothetical protein